MSPTYEEEYYSKALNKIWLHVGDIKELPKEWGLRLLKHIPNGDFDFKGYVAKCGEAVILLAYDRLNQKYIVWKFALPQMTKSSGYFQRSYYKHEKKLKHDLIEKGIITKGEHVTEFSARFSRGYSIHQGIYKVWKNKGFQKLGIIPKPLQYSGGKKLGYSMDYIEGLPLLDWCKKKNKYERLVIFYEMIILIEELLHNYQIIHRDINPRNWLVQDDKPVLLDFTICKNLSDKDLDITHVGTVLGNQIYSSPKQMRSSKYADYICDIFSLGCTFWSMMTCQVPQPVQGVNHDVWDLFPPGALEPLEFQHPFEKATSKEKDFCYKDISEFVEDIGELVEKFRDNKSYENTDIGRVEVSPIQFSIPKDWEQYVQEKIYKKTIGFHLKALEALLCPD